MNITTLEQAASHLIEIGAVDMRNMNVEGKNLLDACGYKYGKDSKKFIDRQIAKHKFKSEIDFTIDTVVEGNIKRCVYYFTLNAANHVLLAAMTEQGKAARQEAIEIKTNTTPALTGDPLLDMMQMMVESRKDHLELSSKVEEQGNKLAELEERTAILPSKPANTESIVYIRKRINDTYGLPARIVNEVLYSIHYAPRAAGQVRNTHDNASNSTYTVWNKSEVSKLFKRFVGECDMVTKTQAVHPSIDGRFKLKV
ncbi:coil containing protein [Vibrio phage 1.090.B._10N.286.48.F1]|nr:coil containing protein [Vibrio phage 1.090.B._10N.286.48.F1]